jgi:hypothetical protein
MSSPEGPTARAERLQAGADELWERVAATTYQIQRLLTALAAGGAPAEEVAAELTRFGQVEGPDAYRRLAELNLRYLVRAMLVGSAHGNEFLREMLPPHRRSEVGEPPAVPDPPAVGDPTAWTSWYVRYGTWAVRQQAWTARAYQILRAEGGSGLTPPDGRRDAGQLLAQERLNDYLADLSELGLELMRDGLSATDESVRALSDAVLGEPAAREVTVEARGQVGTIARADLAIENNRRQPADVRCSVDPADGLALAVTPAQFQLPPGRTERVSIRVGLPDAPTDGSIPAGTITVRGYGDETLLVRVRATAVGVSPARITIRAVD